MFPHVLILQPYGCSWLYLDPTVLSNYRPISKLPFLSKVLEKVVYLQLQAHLDFKMISEKFQSGFKSLHSTETALLRIFNDILLTLDSGSPAALLLLDLSAAFDTVDHDILLSRLEFHAGLKGSALQWFRSYLSERSFHVNMGPHNSKIAPLKYGVPQCSILGPALFALYLLPLGSIFSRYSISFHCFADDLQIYLPLKAGSDHPQLLLRCLDDVKQWLSLNFLKLNENKTEVVIFGNFNHIDSTLGALSLYCKTHVKNLGVYIDGSFKLNKQVSAVVQSCFFQLRQLAKVKPYLPANVFERVIHLFLTCRLDYCNSLHYGLDQATIHRLQMVQNAAARLLTGTKRREHITPVLASLHWLPVSYRIQFKVLLFVFKSLNARAPPYLSELLSAYAPRKTMRSSSKLMLSIPRTNLKSRGDRSFSVAGPRLWNSLPLNIRSAQTLEQFKSLLKTHFYALAFNTL
uniref:Reverse transcriptase domain-containing protein n=1 Tax=Oreochromis niloticus TaxID=8128 RepID=A0A669BFN4_ORENI